jgi:predicted Zn-dependent protease/transglutaminase-like putative cysteine protease
MKIWVSAFLTASLVASGPAPSRAQKPITLTVTPSIQPNYTSESLVFDSLDRVFRYAADGTGSKQITGVIEVHDQAGVKAMSVISFPFASSAEHIEIDYIRVRRPDGTVIPTPASDAQDLPAEVTREAPFYSDIKQEQIPIRSLREGDHLEYQVRIVRTKPEAPGHFWGNEAFFTPSAGFVVLSESVELHVPKASFVQVWSPRYKSTLTETTDEHIYHWHSAQLEPVAGKEKNALLLLDKNPTLGTDDDPKLSDISWTNFHSWAEVGAWYHSLEGSRTEPDDDIRARVATLTAGKSTAEDKARALYGFVGSQVRYIGVAFGIGRYQPHTADDVLSNQYGDCKDKTTLLISMLSAANIPADAVLIGAGISFNEAVPSPASFNHAINLAHVDGKPVWLDSTAEVAPYQLLVSVLRGKKALVIPAVGDAHIETTPVDPPFPSEIAFKATGTLDDQGTSHSHFVMDLRGEDEVSYRQAVRSVSPAQWDQLMQNISQNMSFAGKVTNTQFTKPDDTSPPFHIAYDYEREKNGDWDNLRILSQLPPVGLGDTDEKNPPVTPIELGDPHTEVDHAEMTLPKGWRADLPPSIHAKASFATIDVTYKFENNTLTTDRHLQILKKDIPASEWHAYHQWITDAKITTENYIQLVNNSSSSGTTADQPLKGSNDPAAADLIRQVAQAEQRKDWVDAKKKLDQAQKLSPSQPFLWSNYGYLAMQNGDVHKAIDDYKLELSTHPDEPNVSRLLAATYMQQHQFDDAVTTLQAAIGLNPADESTVLYLASIQNQHGDASGAEKSLRIGLAAKSDSAAIKMQLGVALLHEKKTTEGEAILRDIASTSDDLEQLNDAAYELADASLDLPLAEKASRRSLDLLDQATNNGETGPNALRRADLLVSSWDTLGWILFREDKIAEAEPWIRAAWRNSNAAESGYHLAIILEKEHHPTEAMAQLDLAASGEPGANAAGVQKLIADEQSTLLKSGAPLPAKNARLSLQDQRTYSLARGKVTTTGQGWATVELELTAQGANAVRIVQGDDSLQPLTDTIQHLNLDLKIPPDSHANLVRRGVLSCHTSTTCQLVLVPPQSALNP